MTCKKENTHACTIYSNSGACDVCSMTKGVAIPIMYPWLPYYPQQLDAGNQSTHTAVGQPCRACYNNILRPGQIHRLVVRPPRTFKLLSSQLTDIQCMQQLVYYRYSMRPPCSAVYLDQVKMNTQSCMTSVINMFAPSKGVAVPIMHLHVRSSKL